jgi:hypothetical protein
MNWEEYKADTLALQEKFVEVCTPWEKEHPEFVVSFMFYNYPPLWWFEVGRDADFPGRGNRADGERILDKIVVAGMTEDEKRLVGDLLTEIVEKLGLESKSYWYGGVLKYKLWLPKPSEAATPPESRAEEY